MSSSDDTKKDSNQLSWQESGSQLARTSPNEPTSDDNNRRKLIEQARNFLRNESVVDADTSKQVEFLKTKGLSEDEINGLIKEGENLKKSNQSVANLSPNNVESFSQSEIIEPESSTSSMPPVITYPEFLTSPSAPTTPLLTSRSLLKIFYTTSFLTASIYGSIEYILSPMLEKLSDCRHELFSTTLSNLNTLSQKLETVVSEVPTTANTLSSLDINALDSEKEDDSAKLFHRDIGIQTSLSMDSSETSNAQPALTFLERQSSHYSDLHIQLKDLSDCQYSEANDTLGLHGKLIELREYLNATVSYSSLLNSNNESKYRSSSTIPGFLTKRNITGVNGEIDEVAKVKKEIKGMKGLLLSARTFPGLKTAVLPTK
ncbi:putative peroxisomal membrane anchor [Golovinomyces cichoracearum]|uniref:Peroxisomal membrane protein PEX14 n=1 Tax=Golovinomyces cichoracearum TaxID=62708 RepID=A0A420HUA1_9PEZI|nr:putative peroxisomal membrane anchor [Golovinomyces cichoracearum]